MEKINWDDMCGRCGLTAAQATKVRDYFENTLHSIEKEPTQPTPQYQTVHLENDSKASAAETNRENDDVSVLKSMNNMVMFQIELVCVIGLIFFFQMLQYCYDMVEGDRSRQSMDILSKCASENGYNNPLAQGYLAICLSRGTGLVEHDGPKAAAYASLASKRIQRAAESGCSHSKYVLGVFHYMGLGVAEDEEMAVKLLEDAATHGKIAEAADRLGWCYRHGEGVEQSLEEAVKWHSMAAEWGLPAGYSHLASCYDKDFPQLEIIPGMHSEALRLYRIAAEMGSPHGQYNLAQGYHEDDDKVNALRWYLAAFPLVANLQNPNVANRIAYNVATIYQHSSHLKANATECVKWFREAASRGDYDAYVSLGGLYFEGTIVRKDFIESTEWFLKASVAVPKDDEDREHCITMLGNAYRCGYGIPKNLQTAFHWFVECASARDPITFCNVARCYEVGVGVEKNLEMAIHWYKQAAEHGDATAQNKVRDLEQQLEGV